MVLCGSKREMLWRKIEDGWKFKATTDLERLRMAGNSRLHN
jgi:hypothetical protein